MERAVAFGIFGASYTGAFQHHLFDWLSSNCHGHTLARLCSASPAAEWVGWLGAAMERTLLNQLIIIPLLYLPYYFLVSGMVKGHSPRAIVASARRRYLPLLRRNWAFWVPVQFSFFTLVDPQHLVLATCLAGLAWNALLSSLTYRHPRRGAQPLVAN